MFIFPNKEKAAIHINPIIKNTTSLIKLDGLTFMTFLLENIIAEVTKTATKNPLPTSAPKETYIPD